MAVGAAATFLFSPLTCCQPWQFLRLYTVGQAMSNTLREAVLSCWLAVRSGAEGLAVSLDRKSEVLIVQWESGFVSD